MAERPAPQAPLDRYVVLEYLAEGGMGAIYLGKKLGAGGFEKEVVLKQLLPEFTQQPEFIDLFLREARLSATLDHANIVHTIDLVKAGDEFFIVMEYVRGGDLRTLLKRAKRRKKRLLPAGAIFIARELLSALAYAHNKAGLDGKPLGLIHRDVSPSNVLVSGTGEVKLTDFGIAKASTHRSIFYRVKGKVGYMSPEQARGETLDPRSDLYSVAVCLYEMLTGERLFVQAGITTSAEDLYKQPVPAVSRKRPGLPPALDKVMFKALNVDRNGRYQSAGEFQEALLRVAHRNGLMFGAPDLARHLVDVCGAVEEWGTATVKEMPREGAGTQVLGDQGPTTDQIRLTQLGVESTGAAVEPSGLVSVEEIQNLDDYLEEEPDSDLDVDAEWARPVSQPRGKQRQASDSQISRLTGLEFTSVIRPEELTNIGSRPLVEVATPGPHSSSGGSPAAGRPSPSPGGQGEPGRPSGAAAPEGPAAVPRPAEVPAGKMASGKYRAATASPQLPTERVERVSRGFLSTIPTWVVLVALALVGVAIAVAIALSGPELDPPPLMGSRFAAATPGGRPASPAPSPSPAASAPQAPSPPAGPTAKLTVESEPPNAAVLIDDAERCRTPCTLEQLSATSPVLVRVVLGGHLPWTTLVDFAQVTNARRIARLRPEPKDRSRWGQVSVRTNAPAELLVNGEPIGHVTTAGPVALPAGDVELTVVGTGGATKKAKVRVTAGATIDVDVSLP